MNKKIAKKWTKALRSRKYKKGMNFLCQVDDNGKKRHCCLGVLCELYQEEVGGLSVTKTVVDNETYISYSRKAGSLPKKVMLWAGMKSDEGEFRSSNDFTTTLAQLNDDLGTKRPFYKMAEIIDNNWEKL